MRTSACRGRCIAFPKQSARGQQARRASISGLPMSARNRLADRIFKFRHCIVPFGSNRLPRALIRRVGDLLPRCRSAAPPPRPRLRQSCCNVQAGDPRRPEQIEQESADQPDHAERDIDQKPCPCLFTILLPINPAIRPSMIQLMMPIGCPLKFCRYFLLLLTYAASLRALDISCNVAFSASLSPRRRYPGARPRWLPQRRAG